MARNTARALAQTSNTSRAKSVGTLPVKTFITTLKPRKYGQTGRK